MRKSMIIIRMMLACAICAWGVAIILRTDANWHESHDITPDRDKSYVADALTCANGKCDRVDGRSILLCPVGETCTGLLDVDGHRMVASCVSAADRLKNCVSTVGLDDLMNDFYVAIAKQNAVASKTLDTQWQAISRLEMQLQEAQRRKQHCSWYSDRYRMTNWIPQPNTDITDALNWAAVIDQRIKAPNESR
jgi:hypothetical protein